MAQVYFVQANDTLWSFTKEQLKKRNMDCSNQKIVEYMEKIASASNDSINSFANKNFIAGKSFEFDDSIFNDSAKSHYAGRPNAERIYSTDTIENCDALRVDSGANKLIKVDLSSDSTKKNAKNNKIPAHNYKKVLWSDTKKQQDRINNLPTNRERIIAYNKEINESRDNYVIIDKQKFTATVYTWDGKIVKSYEVGVAKEKNDALLRRSKKHPEKNIASTSAGIYTANYRATGKDAYRRLYNNRVLTLSNDGLREKGVGNGETGVALHQIPNGNTYRVNLMKRKGATPENNRFSSGCVNFMPEDFDDCMSNIKGVGTKVYILPEDKNNYMCVKNGRLHFTQNEYTKDVATTSTKNDKIKGLDISPADSDNMRQEGKDMAFTLSLKKNELISKLKLDNDTYNELAKLVLCMAGQETGYGKPQAGMSIKKKNAGYWVKENMPWLVNMAKKSQGNNSYNSRGLTQCKLKSYVDPETKKLLKEYNITEDNLREPEKAAIGTMIVLACIYKNELPALKDKIKKCGLSKTDALLYCYQGRKWKIQDGTARSTYEYIKNLKSFEKDFVFYEYDPNDLKEAMRKDFSAHA